MPYQIVWSKSAIKDLRGIDAKANHLIRVWVRENLEGCENPRTVANGKALQGTKNGWRYRVGSYRILVEIQDAVLLIRIIRAGHRQGVYRNF